MALKTSELYCSHRKSRDEFCDEMNASGNCQSHWVNHV